MFWTISKHEYYDTCIIIQKKMFFPKFYLSSGKNSLKGCWPPGCEYCCPGVLFFCPCAILKYKVTIIPIKHIVKFDFTLIPFIIYWDTHYITVRNQKSETHVYIVDHAHESTDQILLAAEVTRQVSFYLEVSNHVREGIFSLFLFTVNSSSLLDSRFSILALFWREYEMSD